MGRERLESGGRTGGANVWRRATLLRILACALAGTGGAGRVIGGPVVGLPTADFYAAYLQSAIDAGRRKLGGPG
jgi:hypothetical protein